MLEANGIPTRVAYGKALAEIGESREDIVVVDADISKCTYTCFFAQKFPERFFNFGVAEQNMMAVAAGFASTGKTVFASTYAVFASMRACEQVRTFICYPNMNVKIAASHGGCNVGPDGVSHQGLEDVGIMRSLPNMKIVVPADAIATKATIQEAVDTYGPVYIRLIRGMVPNIYKENQQFSLGKAIKLREGNDATLIASGIMVSESLAAAEKLAQEGLAVTVLDAHSIKPLDEELILKCASQTKAIVTVEDHNIIGGLGSAVAELLTEKCPTIMQRVGINDTFTESGTKEELFEKYGLSQKHIIQAVKKVIHQKEKNTL